MTVRREHAFGKDTVLRTDRLTLGPIRLFRHRSPESDPYRVGFDQHDDANYTLAAYVLTWGRLKVEWRASR